VTASHSPPGCKIRITSKGLDLGKGPGGTRGAGKSQAGTLLWGLPLGEGLPAHGAAGEGPGAGWGAVLLAGWHSLAAASPGSLCLAVKQEGLRFVEQELQNITVSDLHGKEGQFHYNISQ